MIYFINQKCTKSQNCLEVCPADCIYEADKIYVIDPEACIDCGACETECPVGAIKNEDDQTEEDKLGGWLEYNKSESEKLRRYSKYIFKY